MVKRKEEMKKVITDPAGTILKKFYGVSSDPAKLGDLTKGQLVALNEITEQALEDLSAQRVAVRAELLDKIEGDGEVIDDKAYTKIQIYNFDIELEKARDLGATKMIPAKETIDTSALKKLLAKGVKIKHDIVERLMIREIKEKK